MLNPFFSMAMKEALEAYNNNEVPIGAVLVKGDKVVSHSGNQMKQMSDPLMHAEIIVITQAIKSIGYVALKECDLYVTLEPCPMCAHAVSLTKIRRVFYGADCPYGSGVKTWQYSSHTPEFYGGFCADESCTLIKRFFARLRYSKCKIEC